MVELKHTASSSEEAVYNNPIAHHLARKIGQIVCIPRAHVGISVIYKKPVHAHLLSLPNIKMDIRSLTDRIDIHIEVPHVDYKKLRGDRAGASRIDLSESLSFQIYTMFL